MIDELKKKLVMELGKLDAPWVKKIEYNSEGANLSWLPVAKLCGGRFLLGLTSKGLWARSTEFVIQTVSDETACVFFLPVLEDSPEVVRCKMIDGLKGYGLSEGFIDLFPFEKVVMAGLRSQSEYWSGLALKWALFVPRSNSLEAEVGALSKAGETQQIRHLARKIAKQLRVL
ncbi:hypothetical protein [Pseudomonas palleroniana]|uniref:hypothetical protein n=1 Tax=Pseudomonas palleroniana TaxID=191390 RepID=UPI001FD0922E|nr:hypothetical protein [Pseudomonas palleroniana]UOP13235.1 hypothetical protein LDL65_11990 [Pseudomonas palleroniana]